MNTQLTEDQAELESACQRLLEKEWPLDKAQKVLGPGGTGHSPELWRTIVDAGWLGLPFLPELGGAGGDLIDLGLVYRAAGERLVPSTLYSCMFAELLIDRLGTPEQKRGLLPPVIAGEKQATVAFSEPHASEKVLLYKTAAARSGQDWVLNGVKTFVLNANTADTILVLANARDNMDRGGWGLFAVNQDQIGPGLRPLSTMGGEAMFELTLENMRVPGHALLGGTEALGTTLAQFADVVEIAISLQCMEMVGGINEVMKRTIAYMSERKQAGRVLGTHQAVQHLLANVSIQLEGARVAALRAIFLKSKGRSAPREVAVAKVSASETYVSAVTTAHQLWGSMGYARETGLYLWSERAKVTDLLFGTRASHLNAIAAQVGL